MRVFDAGAARRACGSAAAPAVCWIALSCSAACGTTAHVEQVAEPYAVHAAGRPAIVDETTPLALPAHELSGLFLNAEVCDGRAYLFAPSVKSVQVADLSTRRVDRRIGRPGNGPHDLRHPYRLPSTVAITCCIASRR